MRAMPCLATRNTFFVARLRTASIDMAFDNSWQMTDWENGLGTDSLNDDYKGTNELKLTSRLIKVRNLHALQDQPL